jgi:hypothetical protein
VTNISSLRRPELFDYTNNSYVMYFRPQATCSSRLLYNIKFTGHATDKELKPVFPNTERGYFEGGAGSF